MKHELTNLPIANGSTHSPILDPKSKKYADFLIKIREEISEMTNGVNRKWGRVLTTDECEDVIQETLIFFHEKYQGGVYDSNRQTPSGYLWFQVLGRIQKIVRHKKRYGQLPAVITADEVENDGGVVVLSNNRFESHPDVCKHDRLKDINELMAKGLSDKDRQILKLKADGLSNEKIAEILQLPYVTVTTRICRAKKRFRSVLEAGGYHSLMCRVA